MMYKYDLLINYTFIEHCRTRFLAARIWYRHTTAFGEYWLDMQISILHTTHREEEMRWPMRRAEILSLVSGLQV